MPLLQGLARLLELLSNWFNVTLGAKLLDHLKKWLEPEKLAQSQKSWKTGDEPKIAAGDIFCYSSCILFLSNRILCVGRDYMPLYIYKPYFIVQHLVTRLN